MSTSVTCRDFKRKRPPHINRSVCSLYTRQSPHEANSPAGVTGEQVRSLLSVTNGCFLRRGGLHQSTVGVNRWRHDCTVGRWLTFTCTWWQAGRVKQVRSLSRCGDTRVRGGWVSVKTTATANWKLSRMVPTWARRSLLMISSHTWSAVSVKETSLFFLFLFSGCVWN